MDQLAKYRVLMPAELWQQPLMGEVLTTFKKFWDMKPTEVQFARAFKGLPIYPELLYYMVNNPIKV